MEMQQEAYPAVLVLAEEKIEEGKRLADHLQSPLITEEKEAEGLSMYLRLD